MPLYALKFWLHRNDSGLTSISSDEPFLFELPGGIAVYPVGMKYPRLPLLGLRAILSNNLYLTVDGGQAAVTLRTPDLHTRLLSWFT